MIPLQVLAGVRKPSWWHVTDTEAVCLFVENSHAAAAFVASGLPNLRVLVVWWST